MQVFPGWLGDAAIVPAVEILFAFGAGEDRVTGYLYGDGKDWPRSLAEFGPALLDRLESDLGVRFTHVAYQGYRNGSGCDWHADTPFDAQAILSLGVTRTFGVRLLPSGSPTWISVHHGDLVFMPPGFQNEWEHCVPVEDEPGERTALVFRTAAKG